MNRWDEDFEEEYVPRIHVVLSCNGNHVDEASVKIEDIEEDFFGRDVLTFVCPDCGLTHRSLRLGGY